MGDQIIYLEKYIDSTTSLPAELNRILNSIKDLDERSDDLAAQIQENVEAVLRMAPASGASSRGKGGGDAPRELKELRDQIDRDQQLLIQFAEEKVQLAVQLHAMGMGDQLAGVSMGPDYSGGTFEDPAPTRQRAGSRMRDVPSFDSIEQAAVVQPDPKPRKTTITLNLSRQISGLDAAGGGGGDAQTPGVDSLGAARMPQRPGTAPPRKAITPAPLPTAPATEGYQRNRRAAAAGVHAVAAEVAAMEEDEEEQAAAAARHRGGGGGVPGGGAMPAHLQGQMPSAEVAQMFQGQGHY